MFRTIIVLSTIVLINPLMGLNILVILPHQIKSHFATFYPLLAELQHRGHGITLISHFGPTLSGANLTHVNLAESVQLLREVVRLDGVRSALQSRLDKYFTAALISSFAEDACRGGLASVPFQKFLHRVKPSARANITHAGYDLVLAEFFNTDCFLALGRWINAPVIALSSCAPLPWTHSQLGNPNNPSHSPVIFLDYIPPMSFPARVENTLTWMLSHWLYRVRSVGPANFYAKQFIDSVIDDVSIWASNFSVLLVNTHFSLSGAHGRVPGVVEIGGIHIGRNESLPMNIEKWINESKEGVIYFSMGSMIKGHTFPEEKRKIFLRAFGRLKQRVLWKWENETMPDKPDNVMIQKWMPQFDILSHPNVKAFISHGGLLGTTEAVHCGVPVVVMPQFGDQHTNARALEAGGGGVVLNFREADEEMVYQALKKVLDPEFNKKAKELSARFRDRPMSPMDTAIYWIEYVARHKGAHHLRTAAVGMPLYQYLLLDVFGFLALCVIAALLVIYFTIKMMLRLVMALFSSGDKKQKKQKKN